MALASARSTLLKSAAVKTLLGKNGSFAAPIQIQVATLRATYGEKYPYAKPWPYEETKFNLLYEFFDTSVARLNENSKVIVVEGNVGCGKNEFAKRLASNFDLKYIPSVTEEDLFTTDQKLDIRIFDELLPESAQQYTTTKFLNDPKPERGLGGRLQLNFYRERFFQYYKALLHLFSTGQGVVLVRSPFSDRVFVEAKQKLGWVNKRYLPWYDEFVDSSVCMMLKPHVVVYLDTPVDVCLQNINNRARKGEKGSRNLNAEYLTNVEHSYKSTFLQKQRTSQEVVEIDWREVGDDMDMDVITEEISSLNLENDGLEDPKFQDWRVMTEDQVGHYRKLFASDWQMTNLLSRPQPMYMPELVDSYADHQLKERVIYAHPAYQYEAGWAPQLGDKTLWRF